MAGKGKVKGIDNRRFRDNDSIGVVGGGVNLVVARKGISGGKFGTGENLPGNIEVLQKQRPMSLSAREFAGIFDVGQVLMIGNYSDWV